MSNSIVASVCCAVMICFYSSAQAQNPQYEFIFSGPSGKIVPAAAQTMSSDCAASFGKRIGVLAQSGNVLAKTLLTQNSRDGAEITAALIETCLIYGGFEGIRVTVGPAKAVERPPALDKNAIWMGPTPKPPK